jgi:hypothetical protein
MFLKPKSISAAVTLGQAKAGRVHNKADSLRTWRIVFSYPMAVRPINLNQKPGQEVL